MQEQIDPNDISPEKKREFARLMFEAFKKDMAEEAKQGEINAKTSRSSGTD